MGFQSFQDVIQFLDCIPNFQMHGKESYHPGLENISRFCAQIGNPHHRFKSIHIAGTNGKGTVSSMLFSVLKKQGYKTGLYTSPHILQLNERFRVNEHLADEDSFVRFFSTFETLIRQSNLSYFELLTAFSFWYFSESKVDIAVIETGLGGRLDATNIIQPLCSVITSISMDHEAILGNTLAEIAFEKAGIIKENTPICVGEVPEEALNTISKISKSRHAALHLLSSLSIKENQSKFSSELYPGELFTSDFSGLINVKNALLCQLVLKQIEQDVPVQIENLKAGLKDAKMISGLKGRFEKLVPEKNWFFDGAHNTEALFWLKEELKKQFDLSTITVICTFMSDKNYPELLKNYSDFKQCFFYTLNSPRAAHFAQIHECFPECKEITNESFSKELLKLSNEVVIFTGSFYFYRIVDDWLRHI